jgi:hypothetical protein
MTPDQKLEAAEQAAEEARRISENPVVVEALKDMEEAALRSWRETSPGDTASREASYRMIKAIDEFRVSLRAALRDVAHKRASARRSGASA